MRQRGDELSAKTSIYDENNQLKLEIIDLKNLVDNLKKEKNALKTDKKGLITQLEVANKKLNESEREQTHVKMEVKKATAKYDK